MDVKRKALFIDLSSGVIEKKVSIFLYLPQNTETRCLQSLAHSVFSQSGRFSGLAKKGEGCFLIIAHA